MASATAARRFLATSTVSFHHRRYAGVAAPLAVGIALAGWALSGLPLFARANAGLTLEGFRADHVVSSPVVRGSYLGLTEQDRARLAAVEGVSAGAAVRHGWAQATTSDRSAVVRSAMTWATTISGPSRLLSLGEVQGRLTALDAGEGVAVGAGYARRQGLELGDETVVRVAGATHPVRTRVVVVFDHEAGEQSLAIPQPLVAEAAGQGWYENILLADDGTGTGTGTEQRLTAALAGSGLPAEDPDTFRASYIEQRAGAINSLGTSAMALAGLFLVVASANALALSAADRRDELTSLQRLNADRGQVNRMIVWEMLLTVGPAWLLGVLATAWMALAMAGGSLTGALWAFPTAELGAMGLTGFALAVVGSLVALRATRRGSGAAPGRGARA